MTASPTRALLRSWALALVLSAALAVAGERWPQPLPPLPVAVAALLLLPTVAMALLLGARWSIEPPGPDRRSDSGVQGDAASPAPP
jgi:hypothetical protein